MSYIGAEPCLLRTSGPGAFCHTAQIFFPPPRQGLGMWCCMKTICNIGWQSPIIASNILSGYRKQLQNQLIFSNWKNSSKPIMAAIQGFWGENSLTNYRNGQTLSVNQKTVYITIYICFPVEKMNWKIKASSVQGKNCCFDELCMNHKTQNKPPHTLSSWADFSTYC